MCLCLRVCAGSIKPWWSRNAPLGACSHRTGGHTMCLSASPTCGALPWYILITHPASFPPSPCFLVSLALTHSTQNPCAAATWCRSLTGRRGGGLPWRMWVSHTHRTRPPVSSFCVCQHTCKSGKRVPLGRVLWVGGGRRSFLWLGQHWWSVDTQRRPRSGGVLRQVLHVVSGTIDAPRSPVLSTSPRRAIVVAPPAHANDNPLGHHASLTHPCHHFLSGRATHLTGWRQSHLLHRAPGVRCWPLQDWP